MIIPDECFQTTPENDQQQTTPENDQQQTTPENDQTADYTRE